LKVKTYATFNGAELVASLYDRKLPAILCTRFEFADLDEIRPYRQRIPALLRPDELDVDFALHGETVAHMPLSTVRAGDIPATPALFQRTAMICQVVTQPSDWKIVGTRKSAPHQHSRHTKCRVGDMARQAIILALEAPRAWLTVNERGSLLDR